METKPQICPHCKQDNYPMVEFCRHCGESLHHTSPGAGSSLLVRWTHHAIDAMFWIVDETARWWEIGKLTVQIRSFRRRRSDLLKNFKEEDSQGGETSINKKQELMGVTEELARLSGREEFLRAKAWGMTPDLLFIAIFLLFVYGIVFIHPGRTLVPKMESNNRVFSGQISRARDILLTRQGIVSSAVWHKDSLYIGGDGGLTVVDPVSGIASSVTELPDKFFVRDLFVDDNKLLIAGFPGIYSLEQTVVKPVYTAAQLPTKLINSIVRASDKKLLIGTIGQGLLKGNEKSAVFVLGTQGYTIKDFGRQGKELWLMHEKGILKGYGDNLKPLSLQILAGRHLRTMVTTDKNVFIGTDQGVVAGYRNAKNWTWTLISAAKPGFINDLALAGDILFIGSEEGVFRFQKGKVEQISSIPCHALAIGDKYLAAVNPDSIMLFSFLASTGQYGTFIRDLPEVGSFTPAMPVVSMVPMPKVKFGRLPKFKNSNLHKEKKLAQLPNEKLPKPSSLDKERNEYEFPAELQKPQFSDLVLTDGNFYLATTNRGVWKYSDKTWEQLKDLPDIGMKSLSRIADACFVYGANKPIYRLANNKILNFMPKEETSGLLNACAESKDSILLLYKDGQIFRKIKDQPKKLAAKIPEEFYGKFHSVWKLKNKVLVVVSKGILLQESLAQWNLNFFKGRIENSKIAAVAKGDDENIYIALSDGRIYEYKSEKLKILGTINEQPVSVNYAGCLWVAGHSSLFFHEDTRFVTAPFHTNELVLGAYPNIDSNSVLVFTDTGLRTIATGQSH